MSKRLFYIEGPDCAGKTTLIKSMIKTRRADVFFHNGVFSSPDAAFDVYNLELDFYEENESSFIMDRGPIAEKIYGHVMRDTEVNLDEFDKIQNRFAALDVEFILCLPPWTVCLDEWQKRKHDEYVKHALAFVDIYRLYEAVLEEELDVPYEITHYDYTKPENFRHDIRD